MPSNKALYTGSLKTISRVVATPLSPGVPKQASPARYFKIPSDLQTAVKAWMGCELRQGSAMKLAASVVFVRDGEAGLETFLTLRTCDSPFGKISFPGGLTMQEDDAKVPWLGPSPKEWQQRFKLEDPTQAHDVVVAAIREAFQETGLLLAGPDESTTVEASESLDTMAARKAIKYCDKSLGDYLTKRGLSVRTDLLRPLMRWQSPDFRHKRYDIHYFATAAPVGQSAKLLEESSIWGQWVNVRELLAHKETSQLGDSIGHEATVGHTLEDLLTPGVLTILEALADSTNAIGFLAKKRNVVIKKAQIVEHEGQYMLTYSIPNAPGVREKCS